MDTSAVTVGTPGSEAKKMTLSKQEKIHLHEFEGHVKEIRAQLNDQLRCIEERTETQVAIFNELADFLKKRSEAETEHAARLEKISKSAMNKHKQEKNRREPWSLHAGLRIQQQLIDDAREEAKARYAIADLFGSRLTASIANRVEDLQTISKKCREIGQYAHGEINRVLSELQTAMKTYQLCYSELVVVEKKLKSADDSKKKWEEANPLKTGTARKHKSLLKEYKKRLEKCEIIRTKCTKAKNEYAMCVRAANAALHRFFVIDNSFLLDCADLGLESWEKSLLGRIVDGRKKLCERDMSAIADIAETRSSLDAKADKQSFFMAHPTVFMLPKQFEARAQLGDVVGEVSAGRGLAGELNQRQAQIEKRLESLVLNSDEVWKSLEAAEKQLHELYTTDSDDPMKTVQDIHVTQDYYLQKFSNFLLSGNLMERLRARANAIGEALAKVTGEESSEASFSSLQELRPRRRIGAQSRDDSKRPRLFGGSLEEYTEGTGEEIPLVVTSTITVLSRFALRHQGLFRVPGSQLDVNRFKDAFERGEDPFSTDLKGTESNSVAGVLKAYLRDLREPLFPIFLFDQFTDCAKASSPAAFVSAVRALVMKLPRCSILLLRYLFAFLNHFCEYADENMMDPHNLAICLGPTLLPIPEGKDQVFYHNFVNELVKNMIVHHDLIFPAELVGPQYDKYQHVLDDNICYVDDADGTTSGDEAIADAKDSGADMTTSTNDEAKEDRENSVDWTPSTPSPRNPPVGGVPVWPSELPVANHPPSLHSVSSSTRSNAVESSMTSRTPRGSQDSRGWDSERESERIWESRTPQPANFPPILTSLRDQLHHSRRDKDVDTHKVWPLSESRRSVGSMNSNRMSLQEGAGSKCAPSVSNGSREQLSGLATRGAATSHNMDHVTEELKKFLDEHKEQQDLLRRREPDLVRGTQEAREPWAALEDSPL